MVLTVIPEMEVQPYRLKFMDPGGVAIDGSGNIFLADAYNHRIRKIDLNGIITTVAGNGNAGYSADGVLAPNSKLNYPYGVAVDSNGVLYIADRNNSRIRKVSLAVSYNANAASGAVPTPSEYNKGGDGQRSRQHRRTREEGLCF
ncbi:NHL repeat-containing protein [Cohnella rhizosphaerae]|uniref:SMP-30/Gluconolactonase/LRE-like region domain-containing protein n=1 Tax=Cohnella rhizosphaerae TaxID=1457232 RepID=A0A9X4KVA3_9BACL|nr:hypothetical protein [Cohnella rhizosphaerae]MDG0811368.1 hypothetical protein [Cohnella rhizosphaerae]